MTHPPWLCRESPLAKPSAAASFPRLCTHGKSQGGEGGCLGRGQQRLGVPAQLCSPPAPRQILWRQFLKFKETELPAREADKNRSKVIFQALEVPAQGWGGSWGARILLVGVPRGGGVWEGPKRVMALGSGVSGVLGDVGWVPRG